MLDRAAESQNKGMLSTSYATGTHAREMAPIVNPEGNFKRIMASYNYPRNKAVITAAEKARSVDTITKYLETNLLFFHAVKGGVTGVEAILKEGYKPASETGAETGAITEMDKLLGTDQTTYFAVGTPNMYVSEHGFDGPLLVYNSNLAKQNQGGYLNMSRRYIGDNRLEFDPYLKDPSQFSPEEVAQLDKKINDFARDFLGLMLPPDLKYIAQFMKQKNIPTILDLLVDARSWELILPHPQVGKPKAIIFRSQDQMKEAQAKFPDLLNDIVLNVQETIRQPEVSSLSMLQSHIVPGSGSPINVYEVYKALGLDVGTLESRKPSPRLQKLIEKWRSEGRPESEIDQEVQPSLKDMRVFS